MLNWDYNLPKNWKPKTDADWIWYLTRLINYGPDEGEKINKHMVKKYFPELRLDKERREYVKFLLYGK